MATQPNTTAPAVSTAPSWWNIRRNLVLLAAMSVERGWHWIKEHYFALAGSVVLLAAALLAVGAIANSFHLYGVNLVLAALFIVGGLVFAYQPIALATIFVAGKPAAGSRSDAFWLYVKAVSHVILFGGLTFMILASFHIESFGQMLALLVALSLAGMFSLANKSPPWIYKTVTGVLVTGFVILSAFHMLAYQHPQDAVIDAAERARMERADNADAARYRELDSLRQTRALTPGEEAEWTGIERRRAEYGLWRSTQQAVAAEIVPVEAGPYTIRDLRPRLLNQIEARPGFYTLEVVPVGDVLIDGTLYDLTSYVRINGKRSGQEIYIGSNGTAQLSFALVLPGGVTNLTHPQNITIRLTPRL